MQEIAILGPGQRCLQPHAGVADLVAFVFGMSTLLLVRAVIRLALELGMSIIGRGG